MRDLQFSRKFETCYSQRITTLRHWTLSKITLTWLDFRTVCAYVVWEILNLYFDHGSNNSGLSTSMLWLIEIFFSKGIIQINCLFKTDYWLEPQVDPTPCSGRAPPIVQRDRLWEKWSQCCHGSLNLSTVAKSYTCSLASKALIMKTKMKLLSQGKDVGKLDVI